MTDTSSFPNLDLSGKTALVTGGAMGLGFAVARALSLCGAKVAVNDLAEASAAAAAAQLSGESMALAGDVSDEAVAERLVGSVVERWGTLDILVNNAGIVEPVRSTVRQELSEWRRAIDVNLQGTYLLAREAARHMLPNRKGAIVNVSSVTGLGAFPGSNGYGVSKAAVAMLTKTLACELTRYGIRVNAVAPALIETPGTDHLDPALREAFIRRTPMGRTCSGDEVARAVVFLASDWASFITGTVLPVDGGWTAFGGVGHASLPPKA